MNTHPRRPQIRRTMFLDRDPHITDSNWPERPVSSGRVCGTSGACARFAHSPGGVVNAKREVHEHL